MDIMRNVTALLVSGIAAVIAGSEAPAQQTIEIPREQIQALPDLQNLPVPRFDPDLSSPEALFRSLEDLARTDMTGTLPDAIMEQITGASPFRTHRQVVWEIQAAGSWRETMGGTGSMNVLDQGALGFGAGVQIHATLDTDARDAPFHLFVSVPDGTPPVSWVEFDDTGDGHPGGGTGFGQLSNHMFQGDRTIGFATPDGMGARSFADTSDADFSGEYLYTVVNDGRIRVDTRDNAMRLAFVVNVDEFSRRGNQRTGRTATLRGWVCEAAAYAQDPDSCRYDALELIDHTPPVARNNVNPAYPAVTVTFNDPVDLASLARNFTLFTRAPDGTRLEVQGEWSISAELGAWRRLAGAKSAASRSPDTGHAMCSDINLGPVASHDMAMREDHADPQEYMFHPSRPLRSGTIYEAQVTGGADGVRALSHDAYLEQDHIWRFSTLLDMNAQSPPAGPPPLDLHVFQTVRNPALVVDKPAMSRIYVDWQRHADIARDWQPDRFEFELALSQHHPRISAQRRHRPHLNRILWLEPQDAFDDEDRRHARHTVNAFGWMPQRGLPDTLDVAACPHAPFPFFSPDAVAAQQRPVTIWNHDPGTLNFHYVIAELGPWGMGEIEFLGHWGDLWNHISDFAKITAGAVFRDGLSPIGMGVSAISGTMSETAALTRNIATTLEAISPGPTTTDQHLIRQTMRQTEEYVPQFLPYHAATARPVNVGLSIRDLLWPLLTDPEAGLYAYSRIAFTEEYSHFQRIILAAYVRWLQSSDRDRIASDDVVVVVVPKSLVGQGEALTEMDYWFMKGARDYRARAVIITIDAMYPLDSDTLAEALIHEFGHVLSLPHNPGEATELLGGPLIPDMTIEGFRMNPSGLSGWNKSATEGNAQSTEPLVSLMWPIAVPSRKVMLNPVEYAMAQRDIQRGFGQRDALLHNHQIRLAQSAPTTRTDATAPPAAAPPMDQIIISGAVNPSGSGLMLDPLRMRTVPVIEQTGPYLAELLDDQGRVLHSAAFDADTRSAHPMIAQLRGEIPDGGILNWPDFRVAVPPHPQAALLRIRKGQAELARIHAAATPPELHLDVTTPLQIGPEPAALRWDIMADGTPVFDVEYSPDGGQSWAPVSIFQTETTVVLDPGTLDPGPNPMVRVTAMSGLHSDSRTLPVTLNRPLGILHVDLPDPQGALAGNPVTLQFDADLNPAGLDDMLTLHDATGQRIAANVFHSPAQRSLSLLPQTPLIHGRTYTLHLSARLTDIHANALAQPQSWRINTQ